MLAPLFDKKFIVAGYGFPAEYVLNLLLGRGVEPSNIVIMTEEADARNVGFVKAAESRQIKAFIGSQRADDVAGALSGKEADLLISMHYRRRISTELLRLSKNGGINLHPSLLPRYRGTNSAPWVLINGESETGFTYHYMDSDFDTGRILLQERVLIDAQDTALSLFFRLMTEGLRPLSEVIDQALSGAAGVEQMGEGTYYPRQLPFEGIIDPEWDDLRVERFIRAMHFPPFPPAKFLVGCEKKLVRSMKEYQHLRRS